MPAAAAGPRAAVVAGYNDSDSARLAVRWAARHAAATKRSLDVVHAWVWPVFTSNLGPVGGVSGSGLRHAAETIRDSGAAIARAAAPGLTVTARMLPGLPAQVLQDAARGAALLVVGSRGLGGVLGRIAGSVCADLAASAPCPLMVVRRLTLPGQPVTAAVDADPARTAVVAQAAALAAATGTGLEILHVAPERGAGRATGGAALLADAVAEARRLAPGLAVTGTLVPGRHVGRELSAAAAGADVLVLGSHRRGTGPGNTVSGVLQQAPCNVLIIRKDPCAPGG
ncbi:universal stress protein [Arthrobacter sp. YD4]|uniref:universal stress protein n=1 Tax=Arthrobacter sp. YD4 TaxID=3058043 RepID=UPI0025B313EB|nr:universal stress protein [Arthrobacter sp. YD4]MDN3935939.1 universal stress protein [Arthrobacter sp. YD4]